MDSTERPEFERHLSVLCAAFDVPCTSERKDAYWLSLERMPILVFARVVQYMLTEEEWARIPKPSQIWAASKRMRATAPQEKPNDGWKGDEWDAAANRHLLAYVLRAGSERRYYDARTTKILVAWKNAWAIDMREWHGRPSAKEQEENFIGCMERAEGQMLQEAAA